MLDARARRCCAGTSGRPSTRASGGSRPSPPRRSGRRGRPSRSCPRRSRTGTARSAWHRSSARSRLRPHAGTRGSRRRRSGCRGCTRGSPGGPCPRPSPCRSRAGTRRGPCCSASRCAGSGSRTSPACRRRGRPTRSRGVRGAQRRRLRVVRRRRAGDPVAVGLAAAHAVGPAVVAGAVDLRRVLVRRRAHRGVGSPASGPTHAAYGHVGLGVDREARRVAQAHGVDLGPSLLPVALGAVEQVRAVGVVGGRQRVGAVRRRVRRPPRRAGPVSA